MHNYDIEGITRKVKKHGVEQTLKDLMSPNLSSDAKESLTKANVLVGGLPNKKLLYSLA